MPWPAMSGAEPWTASEDGGALAEVGAGRDTEAADEAGDEIGQDVAEQVHGDDDVEALGHEHQLHAGGIDDDVIALDVGELLGDLFADLQKQAIRHLEDVGLVDDRDLLATVLARVLEGVADDALRAVAGDDGDRLGGAAAGTDEVLDAGVDVFGVFAHGNDIDLLVARGHAGDALGRPQVDVQIKVLPQRDVDRAKAGALGVDSGPFERDLGLFDRGPA